MKLDAKKILQDLGNTHTNIKFIPEFNGNYYNYITDTIYISSREKTNKIPKKLQGLNKEAGQYVMLCHECIHSIQSKTLHILNLVFSNLSLVLGTILIILKLFSKCNFALNILELILLLLSCIIRGVLEFDAINRSVILVKQYVQNDMIEGVANEDVFQISKAMKKLTPFQIIYMLKDKIILLLIIINISI